MEEKDGVNASQQKELLEFHIDGYEIEELHSSAFELIKRSFFMFFLVFQTLFFGFYMILCLLSVILGLILGHINIHYLSLFFMFATLVIPWWLAIGYKSLFYLRKTTKDLSIKINSNSILFSSDARDTKVNIKIIKMKEKENGILLIFKRVNNQKFSTCRNFLSKIIIWYDCIPLLKSNLKESEIEQIKGLIKQK